jgi:hypothetical protein
MCRTNGRYTRSGKCSASGSEICKGEYFSSMNHGLNSVETLCLVDRASYKWEMMYQRDALKITFNASRWYIISQ